MYPSGSIHRQLINVELDLEFYTLIYNIKGTVEKELTIVLRFLISYSYIAFPQATNNCLVVRGL